MLERAAMNHQLDTLVVTTLAQTARSFASQGTGAEAGVAFERALYTDLLDTADWRYNSGPDELNMGGLLHSRTGIPYEFDSVLLSSDTLYVIEAKRHAHITRQHISEFVAKLLDITLGSADQIGAFAIKPVFVSGLPNIDTAAWSYAVSWGVLLITPSRPTPWELLSSFNAAGTQIDSVRHIATDCEEACQELWRPFNTIIKLADPGNERFDLSANAIYNAQRAADVLEFWRECHRAVVAITESLRALTPTGHAPRALGKKGAI
jgi:hypothetical protein